MFNASIFALLMIVTMAAHLATQSRRAPAVVGFWESETCEVPVCNLSRTDSRTNRGRCYKGRGSEG